MGDFDFRALIGTNYLIATALAVLALATARAYRGYLCVGDLAIPAFALNLGGGPTFWGMHFFILSVMFFPFAFLTTTFLPEEALTGWLATIATYNPVTYVLAGLRALISDGWEWDTLAAGVGAIVAVVAVSFGLASAAMRGRIARG